MPIWLTMFLSLGGSTLIALIVTLVFNKFKDGTKKTIDKRKQEHREEMRAIIRDETKDIKTQLGSVNDKIDNLQNGTQCSLRTAILRSYYECLAKGYKTNEDAENMDRLFDAYYKLGGNSFVQHTVEPKFRELPSEVEYEKAHKNDIVHKTEPKRKRQILNEGSYNN